MMNIVRRDALSEKPVEVAAREAESDYEPETPSQPVEAPEPIEGEEP